MSSIQNITASNPMPADLARKLGRNGVVEVLSVLWSGYHALHDDGIISSSMSENEITEEWYMRVNEIWHMENRALRISTKISPVPQHGDKTKAKKQGLPPTIDFCFRSWEISDEYFGIECKNLYESDNKCIKYYVDTGVGNYTSGRYGAKSSVSSIAGYILSGDLGNIVSDLKKEIGMEPPRVNLTKDLSTKEQQYKSEHIRSVDGVCITIHHLFLDFVV